MQCLWFRHVLQHGVVLQCPRVDVEVQAEVAGEVEQAFLLAPDHGAAWAGRHEQRFDAERVARAEQLSGVGVPESEGEHATQPGQCLDAPVVVGGDDRLAVAISGEFGPVGLGEFRP